MVGVFLGLTLHAVLAQKGGVTSPYEECNLCKDIPYGPYQGFYVRQSDYGNLACEAGCLYRETTTNLALCMSDPGDTIYSDCTECYSRVTKAFYTLFLRNSLDNSPLVGVIADVVADGCTNTYSSDSNGIISIEISILTVYHIHIEGSGLINRYVDYIAQNFENKTKLVPVSPTMEEGQVRIMMSWETDLEDVDIHVVGVNKDGSGTCRTYWNDRAGCTEAELDLDNLRTGHDGSETITLSDLSVNQNVIYVVGVRHYGKDLSSDYLNAGVAVTVIDGTHSKEVDLVDGPIPANGENMWFAGCVTVNADGFFTMHTAPTQTFLDYSTQSNFAEMAELYCGGPSLSRSAGNNGPRLADNKGPKRARF